MWWYEREQTNLLGRLDDVLDKLGNANDVALAAQVLDDDFPPPVWNESRVCVGT